MTEFGFFALNQLLFPSENCLTISVFMFFDVSDFSVLPVIQNL